jgi:hypothetical protein
MDPKERNEIPGLQFGFFLTQSWSCRLTMHLNMLKMICFIKQEPPEVAKIGWDDAERLVIIQRSVCRKWITLRPECPFINSFDDLSASLLTVSSGKVSNEARNDPN